MVDDAEFAVIKNEVEELTKMIKGNGSKGIYRTVIESGEKMDTLGKAVNSVSDQVKVISDSMLRQQNKTEGRLWDMIIKWGPYAIVGIFIWFLR